MAANQQDFLVKHGMTVRNTATISTVDSFLTTATNAPLAKAAISLSFISGDVLDPRVDFTRTSGASYLGKDGYIKYAANNVPRFDYDPVNTGTIRGLLIEEQRTNLFTYSNSLETWGVGNGRRVLNATVAPDGKQTAIKFVEASTSSYKEISQGGFAYTSATAYTVSIFAKEAERSKFRIGLTTELFGAGTNIFFDLAANRVTSYSGGFSTGTVIQYPNGWKRCIGTFTPTISTTSNLSAWFTLTNPSEGYTGDGTSGLYFWGAQMERGSFASSYISSNLSSTTRIADTAYVQGQNLLNFFNQSVGTVYAEYFQYHRGGATVEYNQGVWSFTDPNLGGYNGYGMRLNPSRSDNGTIEYMGRQYLNSNASIWFLDNSPTGYLSENSVYKIASTWNNTTVAMSVNGNAVSTLTNTLPLVAPRMTRLMIGDQSVGGNSTRLGGALRVLQYWPTDLPANQLRALSSLTSFTATSLADVVPRTTRTANTSNFVVQQGVVVQRNLEVPDIDKYYVTTQTRPTQQPTLNLNFLNGRLDPRIAFTRASQASYVGADGYIKYAANNVPRFEFSTTSTGTCIGFLTEESRINYMTYSSSFISGTGYSPNNSPTVTTSSYMAPDGSMNATIVATPGVAGCGYFKFPTGLTSGTTYTYSLYAKNISNASSVNFGADFGPSAGTTNFNLVTGTISSAGAPVTNNSITPFKDGWYRLSTTFVATQPNPSWVIYSASGSAMTYAIWGAQVEAGTFASSYIPTVAAQVTRATDVANISGQHFNSWFTPSKGTLYLEADSFATAVDVSSAYRWPVALSAGNGQKTGFWKAPNSMNLYFKMADDVYASRFEGPMSTITTGTAFKAAISYQRGNHFGILNAANSTTGVSTVIPALFVDNLRIGDGDQHWFGHIRRIVFYNQALSYTATQALTIL